MPRFTSLTTPEPAFARATEAIEFGGPTPRRRALRAIKMKRRPRTDASY